MHFSRFDETAKSHNTSRMSISKHPQPGTILRVDLSDGFRAPEMVKRRPAIVLSPKIPGRSLLSTIVPLSTSPPNPILPHHMQIFLDPPLPKPYANPHMWVKGDIVLTVAFHRLALLFFGKENGQRVYDLRILDVATMARVRA